MPDDRVTFTGYGDRQFAIADIRGIRVVDDVPMRHIPTRGLPTVCVDMADGETLRIPFIRRQNADTFAGILRRAMV